MSDVNGFVPACCREGVGFESETHCFMLEMLKRIPSAVMSRSLIVILWGMSWPINKHNSLPCTVRTKFYIRGILFKTYIVLYIVHFHCKNLTIYLSIYLSLLYDV